MRTTIALLLLGLSAFAMATYQTGKYGKQYKVADKAFLEKQKDLLHLFKYIFQSSYYPDQVEIAKTYHIEDHLEWYTNQTVVKEFLHYWKDGYLPKGEVFSVFYEPHKEQMVALFNIFYYAKDWDTFYKTACWAREYVNEGMFVYAMNAAVLHRDDTQGMVLPAIYEIYPYYFVNSEVIDKAYEYKMKYGGDYKGDEKVYYVQANYSGWYVNANPGQKEMAYFYEDVGLNSFYYYYNLDYPFWLGGEEFGLNKDRRGELFFFMHQQILARYYMERLSNDYGAIPIFDWEEPIKTGFVPSLRYPNGLEFPVRPAYTNLVYNPHNQPFTFWDNHWDVQKVEDYERRFRDAIDFGYVFDEEFANKYNLYTKEGIDMLGKIVEGSPDSIHSRFYGLWQVMAHHVLGYGPHAVEWDKAVPSALEHFETALRDPAFYQLYKRIAYYFWEYKSNFPYYTYNELYYPGVKIEDVSFDKLITFFDNFDWDISNALYVNEHEFTYDSFHVRARQWRLNHKPFTYKLDVVSDKDYEVMVRVFMGPKYDEFGHVLPIKENWINFVEFDKFTYHLTAGKNVVERHSHEGQTVKDRTTYRELYKHVMAAYKGEEEFHLDMTEAHNGFPNRWILPKGKVEGQEFQFFFFISPYTPVSEKPTYDQVFSAGVGSGHRYMDEQPFGYPFDRPVKDEHTFFVPNSYMESVFVYHKTESELNTAH